MLVNSSNLPTYTSECSDCEAPLTDDSAFEYEDEVFCEDCFDSIVANALILEERDLALARIQMFESS